MSVVNIFDHNCTIFEKKGKEQREKLMANHSRLFLALKQKEKTE